MANCTNCGRELSSFYFGEATNLCSTCRQMANRSAATSPGLTSGPPPLVVKRAPYRPPFTLVILAVNVLVFVAMLAKGVLLVDPQQDQLLRWGANFGPLSLGSQPWRIFVSNYLHIGLIHIFVNMWSLWQVGRLSEKIFGGWAYFLVYTATGITGSLASLFRDPMRVSAGASGAIFGLVGALIGALYLGKLPMPKAAQQALLKNLLVVAGVNLLYGASVARIDNSAHVGGLLMGLALGGILGPQLTEVRDQRRAHETMVFVAAALLLLGFGAYVRQRNGYVAAFAQGGQSFNRANVDRAIARLESTVARNPRNKAALGLLGTAYLEKKDYERAIPILKRILEIDADDVAAKFNLGLTYGSMRRYEDAHKIFAELVQKDPKDDDAWVLLGTSLDGLNRQAEAVDAYKNAISLNPKNAEAFRELGLAQMKLNQPGQAVTSLQQSTRLDAGNAETWQDLGDVYTATGNPAGAAVAYQRAEELREPSSKQPTRR